MTNQKSLKINAIANILKTLFSIIFPLITFPYISRVLGVETYGIYQFSNSIVVYFSYLAMLGITTYAIRTGSAIRNDNKKLSKFINEVFSINILSTIISYLILVIVVMSVGKLLEYRLIIFVLSFSIIFTTLGMEWVLAINEDYVYTSIRTVAMQIISIILMFIFVKTQSDLLKYTIIATLANCGANIINIFYVRKYCKAKFTFKLNIKEHIIPIMILFINNISVIIYVNSDITLLGIINGNTEVGLYSVSTKIYTIMKQVLNALTIVAIPRLTNLFYNNKIDEFKKMSNKIYTIIFAFLIPSSIGLFVLAPEIVNIISGESYALSANSLRILSVALIFSGLASYYSSAILIPIKKEKQVLISTIVAAVFNIVANLLLLPHFGSTGAAITTLISELIVTIILFTYCRSLKPKIERNSIIATIIEFAFIVMTTIITKQYISNQLLLLVTIIIIAITIFITVNILLNTYVGEEIKKLLCRRKKVQ